jgi:methyl-accepting chemotaxis protein
MYSMRSYELNGDKSFLDEAVKNIEKAKEHLKTAIEHADSFSDMVRLKESASVAQKMIADYEQLVEETISKSVAMQQNRAQIFQASEVYRKACGDFLNTESQALDDEIKPGADLAKLMEIRMRIDLINELLNLGTDTWIITLKAQILRDPDTMLKIQNSFEEMTKKVKELKTSTRDPNNLKRIDETAGAINAYRNALSEMHTNWQELAKISQKRLEIGDELIALARKMATLGIDQTTSVAKESVSWLSSTSDALLVGLGFAVLLGIILSWKIIRNISKPVHKVVEGLGRASQRVASASHQVSLAGYQLSQGTSAQAAVIEETSSSLEEISTMTRKNADNANHADQLMKEARRVVEQANQSMAHLNTSMNEISEASEETQNIIRIIDEIAFQTNLLALNAAVEAARAGESGASFAVVADEVRNLAMRSAEAARNTASMIEGTVRRIKYGSDVVAKTNSDFNEVAATVIKSGELVREIAAASHEQSQGIDQVKKAISAMDKTIQQNAATADESTSASADMDIQAEQMKGFVLDLKTLVHGINGKVESQLERDSASQPAPRASHS